MSRFLKKTLSFLGLAKNDADYDKEDYNSKEATGSDSESKSESRVDVKYHKNDFEEGNVPRFKPGRRNKFIHGVKSEKRSRVSVAEPHGFEEVQAIGDDFKREIPIIINLQNTNSDLSKRIIDFCSGLTYALEGNIKKVASKVFLITPHNVMVTSEEKEILQEKGLYNQF